MNGLRSKIAGILNLPPADVTAETGMRNAENWDSLRHITIVLGVEEDYGIVFEGDEIAEMVTVGGIEAVLRRRGLDVS